MPALFLYLYRFVRTILQGLRDPEFRGLFWAVLMLLGTGTWFYSSWEGWEPLDALYFSVVTLTTVGYGDLSPQTTAGKIFTMVYIVLGLGILSSFILMLAERQNQHSSILRRWKKQQEKEDYERLDESK